MRKLIADSTTKSCLLDTIPTHLVKACLDELLPYITCIMNSSVSSGNFPELFKTSHVVPLLKKSNLDRNELKNYRPIANQMFLAKILEKIASSQLRAYLDEYKLLPEMQSAYRQFHSTETALIKVFNDVLLAVDKGQEAVVVLLDFSAAFDSIDHTIMTDRFQRCYGIKGTVFKWLSGLVGMHGVFKRSAPQPVVLRPASPVLGRKVKSSSLPVTRRALKPTSTSTMVHPGNWYLTVLG